MNHPQEPQQNFYAVIETRMMDDPRLGDGEIILYARIASMTLKHGYCYASNKYLSQLLRICIRQVTYRLKKLKDCGYIHIETQKNGVLWDRKIFLKKDYDGHVKSLREEIREEMREATDCHSGGNQLPQINTRNNIRKKRESPPSASLRLAARLLSKIKENYPNQKDQNVDKWAIEIDRMMRIDKRTEEEIETMILWSATNDFWKTNIRSGKGLRDNYDTAFAQMNRDNRVPKQENENKETAKKAKQNLTQKAQEKKIAIHVEPNKIELRSLDTNDIIYEQKYNEEEFKHKLTEIFRKLKII